MRNATTNDAPEDELTLELIVDATISLLDEGGLDAFSMRTLAARLGRSTMAPYRHVMNREHLLRLAAERCEAEPPDLGSGPWYERLEEVMRFGWVTTWSVHPWIVELMHRGLAPRERRLEVIGAIYREAGFDDEQLRLALVAHWSFVVGTLTIVRAASANEGSSQPSSDGVFEFNLRAYIAGMRTMAGA